MKTKKYRVNDVTVLVLRHEKDKQNQIYPPECYVTFNNPIPVMYNYDNAKTVGAAYLMRVQNRIIADITLQSNIDEEDKAKNILGEMIPAIAAVVNQRHDNIILGLEIVALSVSFNENEDTAIRKLGSNIYRLRKKIT